MTTMRGCLTDILVRTSLVDGLRHRVGHQPREEEHKCEEYEPQQQPHAPWPILAKPDATQATAGTTKRRAQSP